jgi:predicted SAM-dependent methyltransferase
MKKILVNMLLNISGKMKKNVKYNKYFIENEKSLVNLGCGMHCLPKWINVDGSLSSLLGSNNSAWNKFLYKMAGSSEYYTFEEYNDVIVNKKLYWANLINGVPFDDDSIDVVFTSHFLEHLNKTDGLSFLKEIYRSLKNGGLVRILVPDLDIAIKRFNNGEIDKTQDLFFYTSENCDFSAHKYNYTFETLKDKLEKIGFNKIIKQSYKKGECPDIEYLDVYPDHSLYIEARK